MKHSAFVNHQAMYVSVLIFIPTKKLPDNCFSYFKDGGKVESFDENATKILPKVPEYVHRDCCSSGSGFMRELEELDLDQSKWKIVQSKSVITNFKAPIKYVLYYSRERYPQSEVESVRYNRVFQMISVFQPGFHLFLTGSLKILLVLL